MAGKEEKLINPAKKLQRNSIVLVYTLVNSLLKLIEKTIVPGGGHGPRSRGLSAWKGRQYKSHSDSAVAVLEVAVQQTLWPSLDAAVGVVV